MDRAHEHQGRGQVHEAGGQNGVLTAQPGDEHEPGQKRAQNRPHGIGGIEAPEPGSGVAPAQVDAGDQGEGSAQENGREDHGHPGEGDPIHLQGDPRFSVEDAETVHEELGQGFQDGDGSEGEERNSRLNQPQERFRFLPAVGQTPEEQAPEGKHPRETS